MRLADPRVAAIDAALEPHAWKDLATELLARHVVGALDRHGRLADPRDERVEVVAQALSAVPWQALTPRGVARRALAALDALQRRRKWLDIELNFLLSG